MGIFVLVWWWASLIILLARNKEAMQEKWAQRLFGVPVLILGIIGTITGVYVYTTYTSHDEVTYAAIMSMANGSFLVVILGYCFTLVRYPLLLEKDYAWNLLALSMAFYFAFFLVFFINQLWIPTYLSGASLLPFAYGVYTCKFTIVQKTL